MKVVSCIIIFSFINLYLLKRWPTSSEEVGFECLNVSYFDEIPQLFGDNKYQCFREFSFVQQKMLNSV